MGSAARTGLGLAGPIKIGLGWLCPIWTTSGRPSHIWTRFFWPCQVRLDLALLNELQYSKNLERALMSYSDLDGTRAGLDLADLDLD
jgi:hypothetical protein